MSGTSPQRLGQSNEESSDPVLEAIKAAPLDRHRLRRGLHDAQRSSQLKAKSLKAALCIACDKDWTEEAQLLLDHGAEPDARVRHGRTLLMVAKSKAMATLLLDRGADVNAVDDDGRSVLMNARTKQMAEILIDKGAFLEQKDSQGRTALVTMIALDTSEGAAISELLIEQGADIEAIDKVGRTVLITAVWKNRIVLIRKLLKNEVKVDKRDFRGRNVFHHLCADKERADRARKGRPLTGDELILDVLLGTRAKVDARDFSRRTPLHWAVATENCTLLDALLARGKASVNAVEHKMKTPLHLAAAIGSSKVVEVLLKHKAEVHGKSAGGWTALHTACSSQTDAVAKVRCLLAAGAKLNDRTHAARTPIHIAAEAGDLAVVKLLVAQRGIDLSARDASGVTPLLCAAMRGRKAVVDCLTAANSLDSLSDYTKRALRGFEASIIDFGASKQGEEHEPRRRRVRLSELLYGTLRIGSDGLAEKVTVGDGPSSNFRWVHIPANNLSWCQDLLTKRFMEESTDQLPCLKALQKSFNNERRGDQPHSQFMRPTCQLVSQSYGGAELEEPFSLERKGTDFSDVSPVVDNVVAPITLTEEPQAIHTVTESERITAKKPAAAPEPDVAQLHTRRSRRRQTASKGRQSTKPAPIPLATENESQNLALHNIYMFMPYLHFETDKARDQMQKTAERAWTSQSAYIFPSAVVIEQHPDQVISDHDEMLLRGYMSERSSAVHVRRTLDQSFYRTVDTHRRDHDQVVHRYQRHYGHSSDSRILMVDQLWMWIVGTDLLITSFPQRWQQPPLDPHNVLESTVSDIFTPGREPIANVYELAMVIASNCSGAFDGRNVGSADMPFLDMYEAWIGKNMDDETKLFNKFESLSRGTSITLQYADESGGQSTKQEQQSQALLDISSETVLLKEIRDVRDELEMLTLVFEQQAKIMPVMKDSILKILRQDARSGFQQYKIKKMCEESDRDIMHSLRDIGRMESQTKRIYDSITDLLDLKQKYANVLEARFAREQATHTRKVADQQAKQAIESANQGKTLMVFTIVTVIFLPLSFIAAFFAINITEFPHGTDGGQIMSLAYVSKYVFGIGLSIAVLCVLIAVYVGSIALRVKTLGRGWRSTSASTVTSPGAQGQKSETQVFSGAHQPTTAFHSATSNTDRSFHRTAVRAKDVEAGSYLRPDYREW